MNKSIAFVLALALAMAIPTVSAEAQTAITTTTTAIPVHHHFFFRHGFENPYGIFRGNNVVVIPAQTLSNSVVNQCPADAPVLLSTGQCITQAQAIYEEQTGQLQVGGQVQAFGNTVVGTPVVIGAQGWDNPFGFFHHFHANAAVRAAHEAAEAANTP